MTDDCFSVQPSGFLLELSSDWIVLRASENVHRYLGEYHVRMVGEPLSNFSMAQPLHDLRNSLSRQRSASGIARAYRVRLSHSPGTHIDILFHQIDGRYVLEGVPSADHFGTALGTISRLLEGIDGCDAAGVARRMRALCGFDRVLLVTRDGQVKADCSRSRFEPRAIDIGQSAPPPILVDSAAAPVAVFPRKGEAGASSAALLRAPSAEQAQALRDAGIRSMLNVPIMNDGELLGMFSCDNQTVVQPAFELHAAAELFAQIYAMSGQAAEQLAG